MGADNAVTSRDLRILVDQAAEPVASSDADVVACGRDGRTCSFSSLVIFCLLRPEARAGPARIRAGPQDTY